MQQQGLGATVQSWVGHGANLPISADQVHTAFGADTVQALETKVQALDSFEEFNNNQSLIHRGIQL